MSKNIDDKIYNNVGKIWTDNDEKKLFKKLDEHLGKGYSLKYISGELSKIPYEHVDGDVNTNKKLLFGRQSRGIERHIIKLIQEDFWEFKNKHKEIDVDTEFYKFIIEKRKLNNLKRMNLMK